MKIPTSSTLHQHPACRFPQDGPCGYSAAAFTLTDLLVTMAVVLLLAILPFSARGSAKSKSRQAICFSNLRQLGVAMRTYVVDYQLYPGCLYVAGGSFAYVWPTRLLSQPGVRRDIFSCPAAAPDSWWDTNYNTTLGGYNENGVLDPFTVTEKTRFSYGYNDWGLSINASPQLGLGGDVNYWAYRGVVTDRTVVAPSRMIALGDLPATRIPSQIWFNANLDPTDNASYPSQRPSNRHNYRTDLLFTDGHTESPLRNDVINPASANPWRNRWNNDNKPHPEVTWSVSNTDQLDP